MGDILEVIKKEIIVVAIAAAPVAELRGAIPLGISLGFSPVYSTFLSIIGNILPIPILLKLLRPIFDYFGDKKYIGPLLTWVKNRTIKKSKKVQQYSILGLYLLVAIPLPSTGAWTGCIAATLFNIDFKQAFPTIVAGVITAGIIVFTLSYQVTTLF
ncbi:COG2426 family protein [Thermohalobacter berrensis]|uniref:Ligand-binding protein SH3 n=1 Tax=Thermohalobacter berrensis TaxID=99594 RepID=A0A419T4G3_9FIRM|nr:small multi-drug export protein [Thermohalobacter berrensis]RKD32316.1 ligand-binding protein SH3 [Thermohalobacter berrensis]